jgi:hypothetical protein
MIIYYHYSWMVFNQIYEIFHNYRNIFTSSSFSKRMTRIPWILSSTYNFRWHVFKSEIFFYFRFNYIWLGVMVYNAIFNNISVISSMAVSFISGGNWSVRRKPQTCGKSLRSFITSYCVEYISQERDLNSQLQWWYQLYMWT